MFAQFLFRFEDPLVLDAAGGVADGDFGEVDVQVGHFDVDVLRNDLHFVQEV